MAEDEREYAPLLTNDDRPLSVSDILEETAEIREQDFKRFGGPRPMSVVLEETVRVRARDFECFVHPTDFQNDTVEYKNTVEEFFNLGTIHSDVEIRTTSVFERGFNDVNSPAAYAAEGAWHLDEYEKFSMGYNETMGKFFEIITVPLTESMHERKSEGDYAVWMRERLQNQEAQDVRKAIFGHYIETRAGESCTMEDLRCTYRSISEAVVEFELSASTLRTNSRAMTLSKNLVTQSAADIFVVLRDFRPRTQPDIPHSVMKRMTEWARTKKVERVGGSSGMLERFKRASGDAWQESDDKLRDRIQNSAEERVEALNKEKRTHLIAPYKRWEVPYRWNDSDNMHEDLRSREDKKRTSTDAMKQLHELGVTGAERESVTRNELSGRQLEGERTASWGGGWLKRAEAEFDWMEKDQAAHSNEWTANWPRMRLWWDDVRDWAKRWRWRNDVVEEFKTTSESLLLELSKIDGSVSAREFSEVRTAYDDDERRQRLVDYTDNMKIALSAGDEGRFLLNCRSAWNLVERILRSKGVKQGHETLIKKQDHFRNSFMDFATVAIFFSSITATTLQFSFQSGDSTISSTIVNLCWFSSLVLSIASATNSLLGVLVHQSPEYLRPSRNLNFRFLQNWFKYIPPVLLTISGVLFLIGFCGFTFLSTMTFSSQGRAIQFITTTFTSVNFFALLIIFLLTFTRILHHATHLVQDFTILPALLILAVLALPYMMIFCWIHNKSPIFPPNYKQILYWDEDFGERGEALYILYQDHRDKIKQSIGRHWETLKTFLTANIGGGWKKIKPLIWKPAVTTDGGPHTV